MGYRLSKIYTRTGDKGFTGLGDNSRVAKDDLRVEAIGAVDELNSVIGMVLAYASLHAEIKKSLTQVQQLLFEVGGELCLPNYRKITAKHTTTLEKQMDAWNKTLPKLTEFILPDGGHAAATCQLARAICRRVERRMISLHHKEPLRLPLLSYINRLSDLLFVAARVQTQFENREEVMWEHKRKKKTRKKQSS